MPVKFTSNKAAVESAVEQAIQKALEICGGMGESDAVIQITRNRSIKTDNLRGSITHKPVDDHTMMVGTDVEYAPYVELGHHQTPGRYVPAIGKRLKASYVAPKPFLRPAMEKGITKYKKVIAQELSQIK